MNEADVPRAALDTCRSCKARVIWARTEDGNEMMVDLVPGGYQTTDKTGKPKYVTANVALAAAGSVVMMRVVKPQLAWGNSNLHLSHFVRCPHSKLWRRGTTTNSTRRRASR